MKSDEGTVEYMHKMKAAAFEMKNYYLREDCMNWANY